MENKDKTKTTEETTQVYKKVCPYCGTGIISMWQKQLDFNFDVHIRTCPENPLNQEKQHGN
jgi:predicted molibdopterin-dependent oxidoreductase YjgC